MLPMIVRTPFSVVILRTRYELYGTAMNLVTEGWPRMVWYVPLKSATAKGCLV